MEAVTAIGLAGNVVQFIDFAAKIVNKGHHIYQSADGCLSENNDLQLITSDLVVLHTKLEKSWDMSLSVEDYSEDDEAIQKLALASTKLAQQLLTRLNAVKAQGRFRRWKSPRQAVKHVCSKGEVDEMARRLSQFREQLHTRLVLSLKDEISENHKKLCQQVETIGDKDVQSLATRIDHASRSDGLSVPSQAHHQAAGSARASGALGAILTKAHAKTFRWILDDGGAEDIPWDNFLHWARSDIALYWVCGKAASGKSTLMKFLLHQPKVDCALKGWAGDQKIIKADFFFWALGTPLQRSQYGLLASLLRKTLAACEINLIRAALHDMWHQLLPLSFDKLSSLQSGWKYWRVPELASLLQTVLMTLGKTCSICLFVDGLDEFEGDHAEIALTFSLLAKIPNVKLCLSSRPLAAIEYEFEGCSSLQLQHLTHDCIQQYISDQLTAHRHFQTLNKDDPLRSEKLIDRVATTSSGVFLWVHLVVKSLLEGLTNYDDISDLENRLTALPPELDALYKTMLQSINPHFYRSQASRLLQVVYSMKGTISSLALSLIDDPEPSMPAMAWLEPLPMEVVDNRIKRVADRLKTRCKGLIEVQSFGHNRLRPEMVDHPLRPDQVQYLHLTVKEFLERPGNWSTIVGWTAKSDFEVNTACSRGLLALAGRTFQYHGWGRHIASLIDTTLSFARQAEDSSGRPHNAFMHHLDDVASAMFPSRGRLHWSSDFTAAHSMLCQDICRCPCSSMATHAVFKGLALYATSWSAADIRALNSESTGFLLSLATGSSDKVRHIEVIPRLPEGSVSILLPDLASDVNSHRYEDRDIRPHAAMIKLLLDRGLSPNERRIYQTPWSELLMHMRKLQATKPTHLVKYVDATRLFILYGADLECTIPSIDDPTKEETAIDVLTSVFQDLPRSVVQDLFGMISETHARQTREQQQTKCLNTSTIPDHRALEDRITTPAVGKKRKRKQTTANSTQRRRKR